MSKDKKSVNEKKFEEKDLEVNYSSNDENDTIEKPKEKKPRKKTEWVMTEARAAAFAKARERLKEKNDFNRALKEKEKAKFDEYKNQIKQKKESKKERIQQQEIKELQHDYSSEEEIIVKKKPKKKKVIYLEDDDEEEDKKKNVIIINNGHQMDQKQKLMVKIPTGVFC